MKKRKPRKSPTIKKLRWEIRYQRRRIEGLHRDYQNALESARRHREYIENKFNWFVDLLAEGKTPNLAWLIKDFKDALVRFK